MTRSNSLNSEPSGLGWAAAMVGGATSIGMTAFLGTLISVVSLRVAIAQGLSPSEAYAALALSSTSLASILTLLSELLAGAVGGYISATYGQGGWLAQAVAAGAINLLFVLAMYLNPTSQPGSAWFIAISFVVPLASSILGRLLTREANLTLVIFGLNHSFLNWLQSYICQMEKVVCG